HHDNQKHLSDLSPNNYHYKNIPPILIIHGTADKSVLFPGSLNIQKADQALGNTCELIAIKDAPHRIADWPKFAPDYPQKLAPWLHKNLYDSPASQPATQPR